MVSPLHGGDSSHRGRADDEFGSAGRGDRNSCGASELGVVAADNGPVVGRRKHMAIGGFETPRDSMSPARNIPRNSSNQARSTEPALHMLVRQASDFSESGPGWHGPRPSSSSLANERRGWRCSY